jgi:hypothetical protein
VSSELPPGDRYRRAIDPFWESVSTVEGPDVFLRQFRDTPTVAGHLLAATWCQAEVRNGGFHQFFFNTTGVLAPEALAGFRAIGLPEWASLLEEAMSFFGTPYPRHQEDRWRRLTGTPDEERRVCDWLDRLDHRFYRWLNERPGDWERSADDYAGRSDTLMK